MSSPECRFRPAICFIVPFNPISSFRTLKPVGLIQWQHASYNTNLTSASTAFIIDVYRQLWQIEKAFRMSEHDLRARPIYHRLRDSIEAHLNVVLAPTAVSHHIET